MGITSILRDFVGDPNIVRIITTDDLTAITGIGYITSQKANIIAVNAGNFDWLPTDYILIAYSNGEGFFTRDVSTDTFVPTSDGSGLSSTLADGSIFVGNEENIATGVPVSGDATLANTGDFTVNVATNVRGGSAGQFVAQTAESTSDFISLEAGANVTLTPGSGTLTIAASGGSSDVLDNEFIFVGNASNIATGVALSGDSTITNTGEMTVNVATNVRGGSAGEFAVQTAENTTGFIALEAGDNITLTPGEGSLTISASGSSSTPTINTSVLAPGSAIPIVSDVSSTIVNLNLTEGYYLVCGTVGFVAGSGTSFVLTSCGISLGSDIPTADFGASQSITALQAENQDVILFCGLLFVQVAPSSSLELNLNALSAFSGGTASAYGVLKAIKIA